MFRKITSNRDPSATISAELKKEFAGHFERAGTGLRALTGRCPKLIFGTMVFLLLVSFAVSFTLFRHRETKPAPKLKVSPPIGFSQLLQTASAIRQTMALKHRVDSLSAKKVLSTADSLVLEKDLDSLQHIRSHFNKKP